MDTLAASLSERLGPSATDIIRRDHTAMLAVFHRCRRAASPRVRRGLARSLCSALEVHLQLEEELLYPALREVARNEFLTHATADHDRMRTHIARIRQASPADPAFMAESARRARGAGSASRAQRPPAGETAGQGAVPTPVPGPCSPGTPGDGPP